MKLFTVLTAVLLLASCSMGPGLTISHGKGRVLVGAVDPNSARSLLGLPGRNLLQGKPSKASVEASHAATRRFLATARGVRPRTLSATSDIESMTYSIQRLDDPSEPGFSDAMDPYDPYLDLYLTPGGRYRIKIDITPTSSAAHPLIGVNKFGDQQDFVVDLYNDTYLDLFAHPVDVPALFHTNSGAQVRFYDPVANQMSTHSGYVGGTPQTPDKYFYTANGRLFWFARQLGQIYEWPDLSVAPNSGDLVLSNTDISGNETIYTMAADSVLSDVLWVVTQNATGPTYHIYWVDVSGATAIVNEWADFTANLTGTTNFGASGVTTSPWGDVYMTIGYKVGASFYSGVLCFQGGYLAFQFIPDTTTWTASDSLCSDLIWGEGKLYVLQSPQVGQAPPSSTGMADIVAFDWSLNPVAISAFTPTYAGSIGNIETGSGFIFAAPTRFAAPVQGGNLYVTQYDGGFEGGNIGSLSTGNLLQIPTDLSSATELDSFNNL